MRNYIPKFLFFGVVVLIFSSCVLSRSSISSNEFTQQNKLDAINGVYLLPQDSNRNNTNHSFSNWIQMVDKFEVKDLVHRKDKEFVKNRNFEKITIFFDGKKRVVFGLSDGSGVDLRFTYKCKSKKNYLEIYFTRTRIWAFPLLVIDSYDRLRLGLDRDANLILHKWKDDSIVLYIMPFDTFGGKNYSQILTRLAE